MQSHVTLNDGSCRVTLLSESRYSQSHVTLPTISVDSRASVLNVKLYCCKILCIYWIVYSFVPYNMCMSGEMGLWVKDKEQIAVRLFKQ
jgi:hypothetical protein